MCREASLLLRYCLVLGLVVYIPEGEARCAPASRGPHAEGSIESPPESSSGTVSKQPGERPNINGGDSRTPAYDPGERDILEEEFTEDEWESGETEEGSVEEIIPTKEHQSAGVRDVTPEST